MPSWSPNWSDVRFDHAAAAAAIAELRRAATVVDAASDRRGSLANTATQRWEGRHRETFDDEVRRLQHDGRDLADAMRREAGRIADAAETARIEQSRREEARRQWHRESAAEAEAERERADR
jgi:uncharacterized protein YukE